MSQKVEIELSCFKVLEQSKPMINNKLSSMAQLNTEKESMTLEKENSCKLALSIGEQFISNQFPISILMASMEIVPLILELMLPQTKIINNRVTI